MARFSRRSFLLGALAAIVAACRSDGGAAKPGASTSAPVTEPISSATTPSPATTAPTTTVPPPPPLAGDPFTLGVASGDPLHDSVILWTRLAPEPLAAGGGRRHASRGHRPSSGRCPTTTPSPTSWPSGTAAADRRPRPLRARRRHRTGAGHHLLVPVPRRPLHQPDRPHPDHAGRDERRRPLTLGHASCQHYETGLYAAHRDIATAELDALVWLGDYIYEGGARAVGESNVIRSHDGPKPIELAGYRNRYALYKSDPDLQAAHAVDAVVRDLGRPRGREQLRRRPEPGRGVPADGLPAAPGRRLPGLVGAPAGPPAPARRRRLRDAPLSFPLGPLAQLFLLDGRQHRSDQACGDVVLSLDPPCPETFAPERTMLGAGTGAVAPRRTGCQSFHLERHRQPDRACQI